MVAVKIISYM